MSTDPRNRNHDTRNQRTPTRRRSARPDHKLRQLCRQVHRTVEDVLSGECDDPRLHALGVEAVEPLPNGALLVLLRSFDPEGFDIDETRDSLAAITGLVRGNVAHAIHRKRVPEIKLELLAPGEVRT